MAFDIVTSILNLASDLLRVAAMIVDDFKDKVVGILHPEMIPIRLKEFPE
jgi:hypothetical protein